MFVLTKETSVDVYSSYETLVACSSDLETLFALEKTLHDEKEQFLNMYRIGMNRNELQKQFETMPTLKLYFKSYLDICDEYFNFQISSIKEL